jgi:heterodisulfide reductase subunit B
MAETNEALKEAGLNFKGTVKARHMVEVLVEDIGYEQKVTCCGGALAFSEPEKSQKQIRDIVESAYDNGAEMIVTPCQLCQANVEVYQSEINKKKGTKLAMPVVYYSQLMTVA